MVVGGITFSATKNQVKEGKQLLSELFSRRQDEI